MAQKHLIELLKEDQKPFHLKEYIADKRSQLKVPSPKTSLQVKKRQPICETSNFPGKLCNSSCIFSFKDTPDLRNSPLFEFTPLSKSPCKSPNRIFLHIPTRTSALLLEAALRIHKQSCRTKSKTQNKNHGFGLFGSLLKRLTPKHRTQKREIKGEVMKVSVKDILRWDSSVGRGKFSNGRNGMDEKAMVTVEGNHTAAICPCELSFSSSCNGRPSSTVWSESNEVKSLDMETSPCSSLSEVFEELDFVSGHRKVKDCACYGDNAFCEIPFRIVLQRSPSPRCRTPDFRSPTMSPIRRRTEEKGDNGVEGFKKLQKEEEDEEKEQFSPVSVLDTPFEDDYDGRENDDDEYQTSYAVEHKAKWELLHKLRRFEKLAELDSVELEKRILYQEEEEDDETVMDDQVGEKGCEDYDSVTSDKEMNLESFSTGPSFLGIRGIPSHMKRLVSDLINEEEKQVDDALSEMEEVIKRVCKKIELWNEVESNAIDMMVEENFSTHINIWKNYVDQKSEVANEVELFILSFLMDELSQELASAC